MRGMSVARDVGLGLLAGTLSGLFGIGGGTVVVPVLARMGVPQKRAQATSLVMIAVAACTGAAVYASDGSVAWLPALAIVIGGLAGTLAGTAWIHRVADRHLQRAFAVLLVAVAIRLALPQGNEGVSSLPAMTPWVFLAYAACGLAMGLLSSMMGVGGGIVIIPLLVTFFGFSQPDAAGTSLLVIIPIALLGAMRLARTGHTDWPMGLRLSAGALGGAVVGAALALVLDASVVQTAFAGVMALVAVQMVLQSRQAEPPPETVA